jgi:hypothetical protein
MFLLSCLSNSVGNSGECDTTKLRETADTIWYKVAHVHAGILSLNRFCARKADKFCKAKTNVSWPEGAWFTVSSLSRSRATAEGSKAQDGDQLHKNF